MDISNKTLAMFLVAAIVVSIAGTMISLNRLGEVGSGTFTGMATSDTGNVSVTVGSTLSISISGDNTMDFTCSPFSGGDSGVNSEGRNENSVCSVNDADGILIINDGNQVANVSVNTTRIGEGQGGAGAAQFLDSDANDNSALAYKSTNGTNGGCIGDLRDRDQGNGGQAYHNFSAVGTRYRVCEQLQPGVNNEVVFDVEFVLPQGANSGTEFADFHFEARSIA